MDLITREYQQLHAAFSTPWSSVYFGGGTPSVIPPAALAAFLQTVRNNGGIAPQAEITLEVNPEDIHPENLQQWKSAGINRLSIGIQSLNDAELKLMNRAHTAEKSLTSVQEALNAGFDTLNIDLIFGSPWQTDEQWQETLNWAFSCGANHISAYALTVEDRTRLKKQISRGEVPAPTDTVQARHYQMLTDAAAAQGWDFYEISNLCKPGHRAKHNSSYWHQEAYLGLGPSAHSYDGKSLRWWNISDLHQYRDALESGQSCQTREELGPAELLNEYLLTNIRLSEGIDAASTEKRQPGWWNSNKGRMESMQHRGWAMLHADGFTLTTAGRLMADHITAELMV